MFMFRFIEANSQIEGQDAQGNVIDLAGGSMFRSFDNRFKGIEGYPTLFKFYSPGQITMTTGKKVSYDSVNIDIYSSDLLVKRDKSESVFNRKLVKEFTMETEESTMTFVKIKNNEGDDVYYQFLAGVKLKLFKHSYKIIAGPTHSGAYSSGRTNSIFVENSKVYIQQNDGAMIELKNKKTLFSQFPDKEAEISQFIKDRDISLKNEDEAVRLIEYINTII